MTPLHYAAIKGHPNIVECLVNSKAINNAKDNDVEVYKLGYTPLDFAVTYDYLSIIEYLDD